MENLGMELGRLLEDLIGRGFELPIRFAMISQNGSIIGGYYTEPNASGALDCIFQAEHIEEQGFGLPINVMFVDDRGCAAHVVIELDEQDQTISRFIM